MDAFLKDLRRAGRALLLRPVFALVALATLALGLGSTTAIFSVVDGVLLRPLDFRDPETLVTLWNGSRAEGSERAPVSYPDFVDWSEASSFSALAAFQEGSWSLTGLGEAEMIPGARVTSGFFRVFGDALAPGREFLPEEVAAGGAAVVIVSHGLWVNRLGADVAVLGKTIELGGEVHEIVGVAPRGFDFPAGSRVWRPLQPDPECGRGCAYLRVVGRVAPDATVERARGEMEALDGRLEETYPGERAAAGVAVVPLHELMVGDARLGLMVVLGAVVLVLLIACANVANLLLIHGSGRTGEVALRAAVGATRARVMGQLLTESLLLAFLGGVAGILVAMWGLDLVRSLAFSDLPRIADVALDGGVLAFALGLVGVTTLVFGLGPALHLARTPVAAALGSAVGEAGQAGRRAWGREALLVTEVALSLILLTGAGLLLKSFRELKAVEPGFDPRGVLTFGIELPEARYPGATERVEFFSMLRERLVEDTRVEAVGSVLGSPLGADRVTGGFTLVDAPSPEPGREPTALLRLATPGYFRALRLPLVEGRLFDERDRADAPRVALVNETAARRYWPGESPLEREIMLRPGPERADTLFTVVGVVGDVRSTRLTDEPEPEVYLAYVQAPSSFLTVHVRALPMVGGTDALVPLVRGQVRALDADLPLIDLETLEQRVEAATARSRFFLVLLALFATVAVSMAAVGLYGVVGYLVSRRTREIGIRMAMGAEEGHVVAMVMRQGGIPALAGIVLGIGGSLAVARILESLLYRVAPNDPVTFTTVTTLLVTVVIAATLVPARRAAGITPANALRAE
jgi:predicted permease